MSLDVGPHVAHEALESLLPGTLARGLQGSRILAIAAHVNRLRSEGHEIANFTIGDFAPDVFRIPDALRGEIVAHLDAGHTNYPPAVGVPELRTAVRSFYKERLGLDYPDGSVAVGSGARPPIYAACRTILDPGDVVVYPVPSWNVRYYCYLNGAEGIALETKPEDGFMLTAEEVLPHLPKARMVVLNSPSNPAGTVIQPDQLKALCDAIVDENAGRVARGERPCMLLYDQVYWQLTFEGHDHYSPVTLVPEMAAYTVHIDAISKCWAATGVRVGWTVAPPPLVKRMAPLVGHMGAWAPRAEQMATAALLREPARLDPYMEGFRGQVKQSLAQLAHGLQSMRDEGLPTDAFEPQGAIYLSAHFDLIGRTVRGREIRNDEDLRSLILEEAGTAIVPFSAFGYPDGSGWVRFSVGACAGPAITGALQRIHTLLKEA